jgi:hypothetical protein
MFLRILIMTSILNEIRKKVIIKKMLRIKTVKYPINILPLQFFAETLYLLAICAVHYYGYIDLLGKGKGGTFKFKPIMNLKL